MVYLPLFSVISAHYPTVGLLTADCGLPDFRLLTADCGLPTYRMILSERNSSWVPGHVTAPSSSAVMRIR